MRRVNVFPDEVTLFSSRHSINTESSMRAAASSKVELNFANVFRGLQRKRDGGDGRV